jgi:predicted transposase YbfD/YdcC
VADEGYEINAIPELLGEMDLADTTISVGAAGCQKNLAGQIVDGEGDYILAMKKNQGLLLEEMEDSFSYGKVEKEHVSWDCG